MKTKNHAFALIVVVLFTLSLGSQAVFAQKDESTASLDETLTWLRNFLKEPYSQHHKNDFSKNLGGSISDFEVVSRCTVKFTNVLQFGNQKTGARRGFITYVKLLNFSDLDPLGIEIEEGDPDYGFVWITLHTSSKKEAILTHEFTTDQDTRTEATLLGKHSSVQISVKDKATADRSVRAIKHAIKLCGGKVDPF